MTDRTQFLPQKNCKTVKRKRDFAKVKKILVREGSVLFITMAIFSGAWAFLEIIRKSWPQLPVNTLLLIAVAIALLNLPQTYKTIQKKEDPFLIIFAKGFGKGFKSVQSILPDLSDGVTKIKMFWVNLKKPIVE